VQATLISYILLNAQCSALQGMLGCGASARKDGPKVSSSVVGQGKTTQWKLAALDQNTTVCLFFEITADKSSDKASKTSSNEV
jgi:protein transport protein SEC23